MKPAPRALGVNDGCLSLRASIRVTLGGDSYRDVIAYDCDAGWIMICQHDERGAKIIEGEEYATLRIFGDVRAVMV